LFRKLEFKFAQIKGLAPFGAQKKATIGEIWGIWKKIPLTYHIWPDALVFGMKHPWDKEIQLCTNNVPGVINGPTPRGI